MSDIPSVTSQDQVAESTQRVRFEDFNLAPEILRALKDQGYEYPTPIQEAAIPVVLAGKDVMGAAQTGTGKTAGFSLPIIMRLMQYANQSASPARHPVRALILTPTRELADQVADNVAAYSRHTGLRSCVIFGGVDMATQTAQLRTGVEIVVATPGRLLDHYMQKSISFSQTQILVLDEADRMLDMGFLPDLQRIAQLLPAQRQSLMFSATFSPEIKKLAATFLNSPQTIEVARSNSTSENVTQIIYQVPSEAKRDAVAHIIRARNLKQVIVFSNTKLGASRLAMHLVKQNVKASAIHGDKTQNERMAALEAFKQGEVEVLVATDVAARGLDIAELPCVINFDLPVSAEDYVHRIGRTGRAGALGDAISLCSPSEAKNLSGIEKLIGKKISILTLEGFNPIPVRAVATESIRSRVRQSDSGRTNHPRHANQREPIDPLFTRPYTPADNSKLPTSSSSAQGASLSKTDSKSGSNNKPAGQRAFLLGGIPKS